MSEEYTLKNGNKFYIHYSGLLARQGDYYAALFIVEDSVHRKSAIKIKITGVLLHVYWEVKRDDNLVAENYLKEIGSLRIKIALEQNDLPFFTDDEIISKPRDYDREFTFSSSPQKILYAEQIKRLNEELDISRR